MDFSQITELLGVASSAVGLTGQATKTFSSIKNLLEKDKPDTEAASALLNDLARELTSANMLNVQLSDALRKLAQEVQRQNEFDRLKSRYQLVATPKQDFVFRLREDMADGETIHDICPVCLNRDKLISYLATTGGGDYKTCQADKNHVYQFRQTSLPRRDTNWLA